ncbi:Xaa-Pro peptidase family protein [Alkalimonas collagenimarina]|uniref:Xaa-Pro peptidase family protein n=1 Tax=Alkalimonas collagenimarina TaxID=400390 RepID=A0ABT9GUE3_9GAMM|nr:Xaa-Pro peptidase family protein [Alkalimonas collagenimarina]MDP4534641.1 Xaa-Pro peptidase family protein [Alkalimonas collagenimarina]
MRLQHLQQQLGSCQSLLITEPSNIRYLSGFTGSAASLLLTPQQAFLITDYRYTAIAQSQCAGQPLAIICRDRAHESLAACIARLHPTQQQLLCEFDHLTVGFFQQLQQCLPAVSLKAAPNWLAQMRACKDADELAATRQAVTIAEQALGWLLPKIQLGMTELQLATLLEQKLFELGAEALAFPTILLSGPRSALPHGKPSERVLQHGDWLLLDFGAEVRGYRSDMTRTYVLGAASTSQRDFYQTVLQAQLAALAVAGPGVSGHTVNAAAQQVLAASPYADYAGEGIGHGTGLVLHEYPLMREGCDAILQAGMVVTIEPGLYQAGFGGVRIEDDILITETGIEILTQSPKELTILCN